MTSQQAIDAQYAVRAAIEFGEAMAIAGGVPLLTYGRDVSLIELFDLMGRNNIHFIHKATL